jgi:tight adherence protein B
MNHAILYLALVAVFFGLLLLTLVLGGVTGGRADRSIQRRLNGFVEGPVTGGRSTSKAGSAVARSAVDLAGRVTASRDLDVRLSEKLRAAGLKWSPAEWLLLHVGIAVGAGFVVALLTGFRIAPAILALILGAVIPFGYLSSKAGRRRAKFQAGLADMLQLLSGSLSAGYSVPQAFDTVSRESKGPIAEELGRALLEARFGIQLEDALDAVAARMKCVDFAWIVMSIRLQRDTGGNLGEVLMNVAATLRERERIRRQINVLSAEGRLSAWIMAGLPLVFAAYLLITKPDYLAVLVTTAPGLAMLTVALVLFCTGVFWLTRIVKIEV